MRHPKGLALTLKLPPVPFGKRWTVKGAKASDEALKDMPVPAEYLEGRPDGVIASNVAGVYALVADDITNDTRNAPSFADALIFATKWCTK